MTSQEPTLLPFIIFSDGVIREQGTGKTSLIGTFDLFNARSFPFQAPPFFITIGLTNIQLSRAAGQPPQEVNVNVRIEDHKSGHVYGNATGKAGVHEGKTHPREAVIAMTLPMPPMIFTQPGLVDVVILVDNERLSSRQLNILSVSATTNQ